MDVPQEIDDYLRESIEHSLGRHVSARTLESNIRSSEETQTHLRQQCFVLKSKLMEKDRTIESVRAESSMNAQAVKKFVEENRRLIAERDDLLTQCTKWDEECSLYESDLEALTDFGNWADERVKEADSRVLELEDEMIKVLEELQSIKQLSDDECTENFLIDTLISSLINTDEVASASHLFLEANSGDDVCQKIIEIGDSLSPSTHTVLALASELQNLQKDNDMLRLNLIKAEEEVEALFDENNILDEEYTRLTNLLDSEGSHSNGSMKIYKRKSSSSAVENKMDVDDAVGSPRKLLSRCYITHRPCKHI